MDLSPAIVERVDAVFADMDLPQHPGAALLVIDHDKRVYSKCYGFADLETQRPITADSSFYVASISKQFTAMAIMQLAEQGKLHYENRLPAYFPQFPSWGAEITLRHLLHHTSGLPEYFDLFSSHESGDPCRSVGDVIAEFARNMDGVTNEAVLERVMDLAGPDFPAGSKHAYHGTNYVLLAMIVAIVSGQSFADFLKANIFDPLGMKHTLVYDASRPALHNLAQGYLEEKGRFQRWDYPLLTAGDGGIFSMLDDLFLWDQALNTERLIPKAALEQAFSSGTTNDGTPVGYGFGWMTNVFPGIRHAFHGGSLCAYNSCIIRFLDSRRTIILLTNHRAAPGPRVRAHQVAEIVFGD
jgi:CubicO group peptidase (beta-lactamase class C family)